MKIQKIYGQEGADYLALLEFMKCGPELSNEFPDYVYNNCESGISLIIVNYATNIFEMSPHYYSAIRWKNDFFYLLYDEDPNKDSPEKQMLYYYHLDKSKCPPGFTKDKTKLDSFFGLVTKMLFEIRKTTLRTAYVSAIYKLKGPELFEQKFDFNYRGEYF